VHVELAERGYVTDSTEEVVAKILRDGFRSVSPNGILGDARGLAAEIGEHCVAVVANRIAKHFRAELTSA
jgi:creatinine amidohydrolase